ncbi:conjugation system SOS inhibitor PsiB, partial [Salmonella enterica subsp. enterica serovar Enteritidis]|nr:conjugation system SOS inhibitor PsiB [Salmonella enterica subsp. enterica serovar Enteritidis]
MMRNIITPAVLSTMIPQEFEDWRDGGGTCQFTAQV